jgi:hypothetical protein
LYENFFQGVVEFENFPYTAGVEEIDGHLAEVRISKATEICTCRAWNTVGAK